MTQDSRSRLMGLAVAVLLSPIYFIAVHYNHEARGLAIVCVTAVVVAVAYVNRQIITKVYFILPILLIYAAELVIALWIPLPQRFPGAAVLPISLLNLLLILGIVGFIEKMAATKT
jgi:hypothetical protein